MKKGSETKQNTYVDTCDVTQILLLIDGSTFIELQACINHNIDTCVARPRSTIYFNLWSGHADIKIYHAHTFLCNIINL